MKKEDKPTAKSQTRTSSIQIQSEKNLAQKDNIKDYSRAWEDDRL